MEDFEILPADLPTEASAWAGDGSVPFMTPLSAAADAPLIR